MGNTRIDELGGALLVTLLTRALDAELAMELRREAGELARGRTLVVVNLAQVRDADCSGLAGLVTVLRRLAPGGELRLVGASAAVKELLATTRLDEIFRSYPSVSAALAAGEESIALAT